MTRSTCFVSLFASLLLAAAASAQNAGFRWQTATPESLGLSAAKLAELQAGLAARNTKALLVIRNDRVVLEWYAEGHGTDKSHYTASMVKALVGGLVAGVAGLIGLVQSRRQQGRHTQRLPSHRRVLRASPAGGPALVRRAPAHERARPIAEPKPAVAVDSATLRAGAAD